MKTVRISLPGIDALEATPDPRDYSLLADSDNVLIKEESRGSGTITSGNSVTITHDLGYIPLYFVFVEVSTGRYRLVNAESPLGGDFSVYTTTSALTITNNTGSTRGYQFYIFYDNIT